MLWRPWICVCRGGTCQWMLVWQRQTHHIPCTPVRVFYAMLWRQFSDVWGFMENEHIPKFRSRYVIIQFGIFVQKTHLYLQVQHQPPKRSTCNLQKNIPSNVPSTWRPNVATLVPGTLPSMVHWPFQKMCGAAVGVTRTGGSGPTSAGTMNAGSMMESMYYVL